MGEHGDYLRGVGNKEGIHDMHLITSRGAKCKIAFSAKSQGPEAVSDRHGEKYEPKIFQFELETQPVWTCRYLTNQFSSRASHICFAQKKGNTHLC